MLDVFERTGLIDPENAPGANPSQDYRMRVLDKALSRPTQEQRRKLDPPAAPGSKKPKETLADLKNPVSAPMRDHLVKRFQQFEAQRPSSEVPLAKKKKK